MSSQKVPCILCFCGSLPALTVAFLGPLDTQNFDAFDPAHLDSWEALRREKLPVAQVDSFTYGEYNFSRDKVRTRKWSRKAV